MQCKLCLEEVDRLEDSHFLPKGIYKRLRDSSEVNPNPWKISKDGHVQTSRQIKAPLLCSSCEQRFSRCGEDWVLRNCLQDDGSFPLRDVLQTKAPTLQGSRSSLYRADEVDDIDAAKLTYFGLSIFWRASIYTWFGGFSPPISFGSYSEGIRQYLMGRVDKPLGCSLIVVVRKPSESDRITFTPVGKRHEGCHIYKFPMPGIAFVLAVGKTIPFLQKWICIIEGDGCPILVSDVIEELILKEAVKLYQEGR